MYHHHRNRHFRLRQTGGHSLKNLYKKQRPKIIHYRDFKNFENDNFREDLKKELLKFDITNAPLSKFNDTVLSVLDKHAPKKTEIYTFKQLQFYNKRTEKSNNEQIKTKK